MILYASPNCLKLHNSRYKHKDIGKHEALPYKEKVGG